MIAFILGVVVGAVGAFGWVFWDVYQQEKNRPTDDQP